MEIKTSNRSPTPQQEQPERVRSDSKTVVERTEGVLSETSDLASRCFGLDPNRSLQ